MQLQGLLEAWLAPTDIATFREECFGKRVLFRDGTRERLAPVLALSSWNVRELFAQQTSKFFAWFQVMDGRHGTAEVSPEAAQRLYQAGMTMYIRRIPRSHRLPPRSPPRSPSQSTTSNVRCFVINLARVRACTLTHRYHHDAGDG